MTAATMSGGLFVVAALIIVVAGTQLARYGDVIGARAGLGRSWTGLVLLAATTSLPELFTGVGATALVPLPNIAVGDVLGSCMVNLLILSLMDAMLPEPLSARAHQGHTLSIGFGLLLTGLAGLGLLGGAVLPRLGWFGPTAPLLLGVYAVAMRAIFVHDRRRRAGEVAEGLSSRDADLPLRRAVRRYTVAAVVTVAAALWLPRLGADVARATGLGETFVGSLLIAVTTSLPEIVVSLAAVRMGALDLGIGNVLGSNLFNLAILGLDDLLYRPGPLLAAAAPSHAVSVVGVVMMNALFLLGLTTKVLTKRFVIAWDTGAIAAVYAVTVALLYLLRAA